VKVKLIGKSRVVNLILPPRVYGNYWITNEQNQNLINISGVDGKWTIKSNDDVKIVENNNIIEFTELKQNHFYNFYENATKETYRVFVGETFDSRMLMLDFVEKDELTFYIGNSANKQRGEINYISYEHPNLFYNQLEVVRKNGLYYIKNLHNNANLYINNRLVTEATVSYGDAIFIEGLTFSFVGNKLLLGTVDDKVKYVTKKFEVHKPNKLDFTNTDFPESNEVLYEEKDYFIRPPRFSQIIETKTINIDAPPSKQTDQNIPAILTLGPMLVMGMGSSISGIIALVGVLRKETTFKENMTSIITALTFLIAMLVFPSLNRAYQNYRRKKLEKLRQKKYHEYLVKVGNDIKSECENQKSILKINSPTLEVVGNIILQKSRNLWERRPEHNDFMSVRLGIGNIDPDIVINAPKEQFSLDEDNLKQEVQDLVNNSNKLIDVPFNISLRKSFINGFIGNMVNLKRFMDGIILQLIAFQSYDELKIVIITNKRNEPYWSKLKNSPYCWSNDKQVRFFASNQDEASRLSSYLDEIYRERSTVETEYGIEEFRKEDYYEENYLIIIDSLDIASKISITHSILENKDNHGFSLLYLTERINKLPTQCQAFVNITSETGERFVKEEINKIQEFKCEYIQTTIDAYIFVVSNIAIEIKGGFFELPTIYTFMEMYNAGNVEQLNAYNRWKTNDPTTSLSCPVGIDENGELFKLDLHEKVHGPHGLIAGMTGSGKSEFIITYILSMAVNYDPKEVQFVLIDYKGGGLAGAFENKDTGEKLPHLAGTITNLDTNEINRSLSSLQSELKRRQRMFNKARDDCNESTIDIYKYQKLYREGRVKEPISHLMIISDEFAELKADQPDFMDELISTARIGRSLGVHLILATQKPSGVVDDQIWSNSKFRVCLKVQDKSDSHDMIKSPDAAYIKETGRFYLQVGFNDFFAKGQSAWCGAAYYESEKLKKIVDTSINFVDNVGSIVKQIDNESHDDRGVHKGEEITNILEYIKSVGRQENINIEKLWLDPIPAIIYIDKLKIKYKYNKKPFEINPVIGEYDVPKEQRQNILTMPLSKMGNTIIYGSVGSGKEVTLSSLVYSLITTYTPEELNLYILDFGSGLMKMYSKAPQVGGIVASSEIDKIKSLFLFLQYKIEDRKKLFADYNGSYDYYCANSGSTVPTDIIIVNGFESFNELYDDDMDEFSLLTREGQKYGIIFVVSVSAINNMRIKITQNFNEKILLQMNDEYDYRAILGKTDVLPSKVLGRGMVKREGIFEFQTGSIAEDDNIAEVVKTAISNLNQTYTKRALSIPTLPDVVSTTFVASALDGLSSIPIGVAKDDLNILTYDLKNDLSLMVSCQKIKDAKRFISSLVYQFTTIKNTQVFVIDAEKIVDNIKHTNYFNSSFEPVFESFKENVAKLNEEYVNNGYDASVLDKYADMVFVIVGINKIKTILNDNFESLVSSPMIDSKKLGKISYVIVDSADNLKKFEYDSWYKDIINPSKGIWIGDGLADQSLFRIYSTRNIENNLPYNFAYYVLSNKNILFKYIEKYGEEEELL